ncbi:hypothetical protein LJC58_03815 [Lachnospiraceae bacterium OttesenSCG-928-D06]|nr:hypothetical protein [Lachnospiraceae bacterium OttesenSCG-928-D06]
MDNKKENTTKKSAAKKETVKNNDDTVSIYTESAVNIPEHIKEKEYRLDAKITIKNIAPWSTGSRRLTSMGDISISANGTALITREEAIAQSQNGNKLLNGLDGIGTHATWYITDDFTRRELGFDTDLKKQRIISIETIRELFDIVEIDKFKNELSLLVITRAEKCFLMNAIKTLNINDYNKIKTCIDYTGLTV